MVGAGGAGEDPGRGSSEHAQAAIALVKASGKKGWAEGMPVRLSQGVPGTSTERVLSETVFLWALVVDKLSQHLLGGLNFVGLKAIRHNHYQRAPVVQDSYID